MVCKRSILCAVACGLFIFTALVFSVHSSHAAVADSFRLPLDGTWKISQQFGVQVPDPPVTDRYHLAEDVGRGFEEAPIFATANGTVKHAASHTNYGYVVAIEHSLPEGGEVCSVYGHLRASGLAGLGDVGKGQLIGYLSADSSETAGTTMPHLHFGIRSGAFSENPDPVDGQFRYRGYGPSSVMGEWFDPIDFVGPRLMPKFAYGNRLMANRDLNVRNLAAGADIGDQL